MWGTFLMVCSVLSLCGTGNAAPPQFSPTHDLTVNVGALETTERLLRVLTVSDADGDSFVCTKGTVVPGAGDGFFDVIWREVQGSMVYGLYVLNGATLAAASYDVPIDCTDLSGASGSATMDVKIRAGEQIVINLPDTVSMDALATKAATPVPFTITAADDLHGTLTYSLEAWPPSTGFQINPGNGVITTTQDLIYEIYNAVDLYVTVTDSFISVTEKLRVTYTKYNKLPYISNPVAKDILESVASGTFLYTLTAVDDDVGATLDIICSVNPPSETDYFRFTQSGNEMQVRLETSKTFDYERITFYNVTCMVDDGYANMGPFVALDITIKDINEPCEFLDTSYSISADEGPASAVPLDPGFNTQDPENNVVNYEFFSDATSDLFAIDTVTGEINFAQDIDRDGLLTSPLTMIVKCFDPADKTKSATTTLSAIINDINDNAPTFTNTNVFVYADQFDSPGALLGTITPHDIDDGVNADWSCFGSTTSPDGAAAFAISSSCAVTVMDTTGLDYGTMAVFEVLVIDKGTPARTGTAFVSIQYKQAPTTTQIPNTTAYNILNTDVGKALLALSIIFGLALLGLLAYCLLQCCGCLDCRDCLRPRPRTPVQRRRVRPRSRSPPRREKRPDSGVSVVSRDTYYRDNEVTKTPRVNYFRQTLPTGRPLPMSQW